MNAWMRNTKTGPALVNDVEVEPWYLDNIFCPKVKHKKIPRDEKTLWDPGDFGVEGILGDSASHHFFPFVFLVFVCSLGNNSDDRITQTKLKFNKFRYLSDWKFDNDNVEFVEHFMFNDNTNHRQHIHKLDMKDIKYYLKIAKKTGFTLIKKIDLLPANHEYNYIYIFKKKYGE